MGTTDSRARDNIVCSEDKKKERRPHLFFNGLDTQPNQFKSITHWKTILFQSYYKN